MCSDNKMSSNHICKWLKVPVSAMAQDLLTTYKYGWKTSYYQNTYDVKTDEVEEDDDKLQNLLTDILNTEEEDCESCKL